MTLLELKMDLNASFYGENDNMTPTVAASLGKPYVKSESTNARGTPEVKKHYSADVCCCNRGKTTVFCRGCGYYTTGRVQLKCQIHPRVLFLFDIKQCPSCRSSCYLDEMQL